MWARAVLLTTPTVATVGYSLTIPFAFLSDFLLHGEEPNALAVLGAFLVVSGFVVVSRGGPTSERRPNETGESASRRDGFTRCRCGLRCTGFSSWFECSLALLVYVAESE